VTASDPRSYQGSIWPFVRLRSRTDLEVPVSWLFLPLASYLVWGVLAVSWWSAGAGFGTGELSFATNGVVLLGLIASATASYVLFTLMNRGNKHSSRTRALLWSAIDTLEARVGSMGQQALLPLNTAEEGYYKLLREERERSAVLWALLALIPFVGWIFLVTAQWILSRDLSKHSRLEAVVLEDIDRALRVAGLQGIPVRDAPIRSHDALGFAVVLALLIELFAGYFLGLAACLVLIYLTVGASSLFWLDLSIRDPASHFYYHSQFEAGLLLALPEANAGTNEVGVA